MWDPTAGSGTAATSALIWFTHTVKHLIKKVLLSADDKWYL